MTSLHNRIADQQESLRNINSKYQLALELQEKIAASGNTYLENLRRIKKKYYMSLVRIHQALLETEVCFPKLNKLHKYTLVMYGIDKRCITNVIKHLRKSELIKEFGGEDNWLFINSKAVLIARKGRPLKFLASIDEL